MSPSIRSWAFRPIQRVLATPAFHHWHHSAEPEAVDKNFAVHLPQLDWVFGTYYLPDRWPNAYGLSSGQKVPGGYARREGRVIPEPAAVWDTGASPMENGELAQGRGPGATRSRTRPTSRSTSAA
jgi:hypothetical protein